MTLVTIIGRGHSGTRAISHTLSASGVFMGDPLNVSGDLLPPESMYAACRVLARSVVWKGGLEWNWDDLLTQEIPVEFSDLIDEYLTSVRLNESADKGWKIPETTLVFPWIQRLFPEIKYIFWIRNPRDCILGEHLTDDLNDFGISYPPSEDIRLRRAISWKYQYDLVQRMPKPAHWIEVRFEDFVLHQEETLARLEDFLGRKLVKIPVQPEAVGRYLLDEGVNYFDFFEPAMRAYGYEIPPGLRMDALTQADRAQINGHLPAVLWFTGLSGSGKSTLATRLEQRLYHELHLHTYLLDGDVLRTGLNKDLDFTPSGRSENIRRSAEVARLFFDAGLVVLTTFISPFRSDRDFARSLLPSGRFLEIYVRCPLEVCEQRDPKGLYRRARSGSIPNFTGIDSPYEEPLQPELRVDTSLSPIDACAQEIFTFCLSKRIFG